MRPQFSLRTFVLIVAILSAFLGTAGTRAVKQKQTVDKILKAGGFVLYDQNARFSSGSFFVHLLSSARYIVIRPSDEFPVDAQLQWVAQLPEIESLSIKPLYRDQSGLTDAGARLIEHRFRHLKLLNVKQATCSSSSLWQLRDALTETQGSIDQR